MRSPQQITAAGLLLFFAFISMHASCNNASPGNNGQRKPDGPALETPGVKPILDESRCFEHVKKLVDIGARPSGSSGIEKSREYIKSQLKEAGLATQTDRFVAQTRRGPVEMMNLRAEIEGESPGVIVLMAHYDTKRIFNGNFVGANDGGSGTAVLIELARHFAPANNGGKKPPMSLRILFVDGEETQTSPEFKTAQNDWDDNNSLWGSRHEVERIKKLPEKGMTRAVVLVDMVGDKNLNIIDETTGSRKLNLIFLEAVKASGAGNYFFKSNGPITDDHKPFIEAGIEAIDLIDFEYGPNNSYWHTKEDTLDKISATAMRIVGDVVIRAVPLIARDFK